MFDKLCKRFFAEAFADIKVGGEKTWLRLLMLISKLIGKIKGSFYGAFSNVMLFKNYLR